MGGLPISRAAGGVADSSLVVDCGTGEVVELRCSHDPDTMGANPADGRRIKGTVHWVSARHALPAEVRLYDRLFSVADPDERARLQAELRARIRPGAVDVNIMTKLDRDRFARGKELGPMFSDAMSALRGFASSKVHASHS